MVISRALHPFVSKANNNNYTVMLKFARKVGKWMSRVHMPEIWLSLQLCELWAVKLKMIVNMLQICIPIFLKKYGQLILGGGSNFFYLFLWGGQNFSEYFCGGGQIS